MMGPLDCWQRRRFQLMTFPFDRRRGIPAVAALALAMTASLRALAAPPQVAPQIPTPEGHFGFGMGADGRLASADAIERYFELVASRSDRVRIIDIGPTTEGHRTIAAIVSAPENIRNLDGIRATNQQLADPR